MRDRGWREPRGARLSPPPVRLPRGFPSRCRRTGPLALGVPWNSSAVGSAAAARYRGRAQANLRATRPGLRDRGRPPLPPGTGCPRQKERAPPAPCLRFPAGLRSRSAVPRGLGPALGRGFAGETRGFCAEGGRGSRGKGPEGRTGGTAASGEVPGAPRQPRH